MMIEYDERFYRIHHDIVARSARVIVPIIIDLIEPKSVIDVGCGVGSWLSVFYEKGVDILGIDGNSVGQEMFEIDKKYFIHTNLEERISINQRFDLVVSLEVMEHLSQERMSSFVEDLTRLSDAILFSCAAPGQGGAGHINERWLTEILPLFENYGYLPFDCIRPFIWDNKNVAFYYRQNILLFCNKTTFSRYPNLPSPVSNKHYAMLDVIHPFMHEASIMALTFQNAVTYARQKWQDKPIVFYGAGTHLRKALRVFRWLKVPFEFPIWDIKADEIGEIEGHKVIKPDFVSNGHVVVITIQNDKAACQVKDQLIDLGFIVFTSFKDFISEWSL